MRNLTCRAKPPPKSRGRWGEGASQRRWLTWALQTSRACWGGGGGRLRPKLGRWEEEWPVWGEGEEQGKSWDALGAAKVKVGAAWSVLASHSLMQ